MSALKMSSERVGPEITVLLIGEINETAALNLPDLNGAKSLVFDFMHVKHINSSGIRFWIQFIAGIPQDVRPHFKNIPKIVVDQMSMVVGFMPPKSVVDSFEMPFYCDKCGKASSEMLKSGIHFEQATSQSPSALKLPKMTCNQTDCDMAPDMLPKKYLRFLEIPKD
jgi:hypothetical protein